MYGNLGFELKKLHYSIWTNDRFVSDPFKSIDLGGSFKDAPKRTASCFYPPTPPSARLTATHPPPPEGGFSLFEVRAPSPTRPDFSSLTPTHILSPERSPHRDDLSPSSYDHI
ncbi:hypothetical protein AVEN_182702-1 [Araneus ventricosus]|uniref:Uncharacterized protein n=1 Tax=Araneus ventricosus TaxID=182803 RepID=A0A4Y2JQY3_ARAVE|nr:hypothetical protein AVEN_182702-1 [Araneus ventricosus]